MRRLAAFGIGVAPFLAVALLGLFGLAFAFGARRSLDLVEAAV